jgi:hypothetical protein
MSRARAPGVVPAPVAVPPAGLAETVRRCYVSNEGVRALRAVLSSARRANHPFAPGYYTESDTQVR